MSEEQVVVPVVRPRRNSAEIRQLVEEFAGSGLRQSEFCRRRGIVLNTLKRYLKKQRKARKDSAACGTLVAVELATASPSQGDRETGSCLAVVLSAGRRIEVGAGFDATTLARLVTVLERL
jgi:hypothetical protein